jgi:endonuclease YncB( thermonuclease family)
MGILSKLCPVSIYDIALRRATKGEKFNYSGLKVKAKVVDVYDGDTITIVFRYRGELQQHNCRMLGYDSPELRPSRKMTNREKEIESAKIARDKLKELVEFKEDSKKLVDVYLNKSDSFGRILVDVYVDGNYINDWMVVHGYGKPYQK